jgi:hypothetical protein
MKAEIVNAEIKFAFTISAFILHSTFPILNYLCVYGKL